MKKGFRRILTGCLMAGLLLAALPVAAAENLKAKDFREIYPAGTPIDITDAANGAQITFHNIDSRITLVGESEEEAYGKTVPVNGLVMKFSNVNFPKATTKTNGVTLAFTLSSEPGSFYSVGSSGLHVRIFSRKEGVSLYVKAAPAPDTGDDVYYPDTPVEGWDRIPANLTIKIFKSGDKYNLQFNDKTISITAGQMEKNIARSGKAFVNIGLMGIQNRDCSMVINQIYQDTSLIGGGATTAKPTTAPPAVKPGTTAPPATTGKTAGPQTTAPSDGTTEAPATSDTQAVSGESSAVPVQGPSKLSADGKLVKINGSAMTMTVKSGLTADEFRAALTISDGFAAKVLAADGTEVAGDGLMAEGQTVDIVSLDTGESAARFQVKLTMEEPEGGLSAGWIVLIVAGVVLVLGGGGFAVWYFFLRGKKAAGSPEKPE